MLSWAAQLFSEFKCQDIQSDRFQQHIFSAKPVWKSTLAIHLPIVSLFWTDLMFVENK